mgnify:CR=1 FL=1
MPTYLQKKVTVWARREVVAVADLFASEQKCLAAEKREFSVEAELFHWQSRCKVAEKRLGELCTRDYVQWQMIALDLPDSPVLTLSERRGGGRFDSLSIPVVEKRDINNNDPVAEESELPVAEESELPTTAPSSPEGRGSTKPGDMTLLAKDFEKI